MPILALDVGERRVGVALSDPSGAFALPLTAIRRTTLAADLDAVRALVQEYDAERIVVGLPISMSGNVSQQTMAVQDFADALAAAVAVPVDTWDERLSTAEAHRLLRSEDTEAKSRRKKRPVDKARIDAAAAAVILQSYLNAHGRDA